MLRISLRLQRVGLIATTAFGVFYGLIQAAAYTRAAGASAAERLLFAHQMEQLGPSLSYLLPLPVHVETLSGYLQWRVFGALPLIFGFWSLLSAAGAGRGNEDQGLVELWLSAGLARWRYVAARFGSFVLVALAATTATALAIYLGSLPGGSGVNPLGIAEATLALLAVTVACYGLALVAAQVAPTRASAAGAAGVLLGLLFLLNSSSRAVAAMRPLVIASPFHYYDLSTPLQPGGSFDLLSTLGLFGAGVAFTILAGLLMGRRDIGSPLLAVRPRSGRVESLPSTNPLLRLPILAPLYGMRYALLAWSVGCALEAVFMASIGHSMVTLVQGGGAFAGYLRVAGHGDPYAAITGFFWYGTLEILLAVFAITQVARWTADDNEGRLELILSAPISRARVVAERAATLLLAGAIIVGVSCLGFYAAAHSNGVNVRWGDIVVTWLVLVPLVMAFAAIGAPLASRLPRSTVIFLTTVAFGSYLVDEVAPLLRLPDWALKISVFSFAGHPLASGVYWTGLWILVSISVAGFGLGAILMQRREVGA